MWTRVELKTRAKRNLTIYYWAAFLVSLIFALVSGFSSGNSGASSGYSSYNNYAEVSPEISYEGDLAVVNLTSTAMRAPKIAGTIQGGFDGFSDIALNNLFSGLFLSVSLFLLVIGLVLSLFVVPAMEVGRNRFYMESRGLGLSAGVGKIFWGFSHSYLNIVLTMFLRGLFIFLGTICCVIPGIYLGYCYYMVPYILSENPDMRPMEALRLSKEMMDGHKLNTWVLELSFIGWMLLGTLACCIGSFFVMPYYDATFAELYAVLRRPFGSRLAGFGVPDVVPTDGGYGTYVKPEHVYDAGSQYRQDGPVRDSEVDKTGGGPAYNSEVNKSEGGPGKGYYLNGEFHPYGKDEK